MKNRLIFVWINYLTFVIIVLLAFHSICEAQHTHFVVDSTVDMIDAAASPFNQVLPGDTVFLSGGNRDYLLIINFKGASGSPIVFMNTNGIVTINTNHYYGILLQNCRYLKITGTGSDDNYYGFHIDHVSNGAGISVTALSSDIELDHLSIKNVLLGGIYVKTDPDCLFNSTREKFTQYNTIIHDNYIENAGNEGMYIGSTKYFGQTVTCNGKDTLLMPSLLDGVSIYNNILNFINWDGIQVSSASSNCRIFDNLILYDSQAGVDGQMSGIMLGGGSKCDCYNNYISGGNGDGIESHGLGGYRIFNNIIENAGLNFFPNDPYQMKYGILVTDISVLQDSSFFILFNDIIHPKSDGIRFLSTKSKHNMIVSNAIINPGNFDFYQNGNFQAKGIDSYIMVPDSTSDILRKNNFFSRTTDSAKFAASGYSLLPDSPLIDAGYSDARGITFDLYHHIRPYGSSVDIGAIEFNPLYYGLPDNHFPSINPVTVYPNPVYNSFTIRFRLKKRCEVILDLYDINGKHLSREDLGTFEAGLCRSDRDASKLTNGIYLFTIKYASQIISGKFSKINH
jgi:hypothetical protein